MRTKILLNTALLLALPFLFSCSKEDRYSTSVVTDINLYLDDEEYLLNTGSSDKPLFIYDNNGEYVANYSTLHRFQLSNGGYKIFATTNASSVPVPNNLEEVVVTQDPEAVKQCAISLPVNYKSPFSEPLEAHMYSRTGTLRLKATDRKSDKRYKYVRAIVSTPISGYKVSDGTFVNTPIEVSRTVSTSSGGVNYVDDFVLFETEENKVSVRIEYLDEAQNVIQTKNIDGAFNIIPKNITSVSFELNNVDEPTIQDYEVTIVPEEWTDEEIVPDAPVRVPEGYVYVSPDENINAVYNQLKDNVEVSAIKLFLKAGESYTIGKNVLNEIPKGLSIVGQDSSNPTKLNIESSLSLLTDAGGKIDEILFENLIIDMGADDFFKFKHQEFHVGTITLRNCQISDLGRTMWYQEVDEDNKQTVDCITIDGCRFFGINSGKSGLFGLSTKKNAPVHKFEFKNSTFHANDLTRALITGLGAMSGDLTVTIENCTFIAMKSGMIFFDLTPKNATFTKLVVKNNLFSGVDSPDAGTWISVSEGIIESVFESNYVTKDFSVLNWGVDENNKPLIAKETMDNLFENVDERDFTIKDTSSEIYTNGIGDPYWRK